MTNEEIAKEIAENDDLYRDSDNKSKVEECYLAALETAKYKDKQIKEAINEIVEHYKKEAENDNISVTAKHMYLLGAEYVSKAMNMLKQKLNLEE